jgi:hypothetical protein
VKYIDWRTTLQRMDKQYVFEKFIWKTWFKHDSI